MVWAERVDRERDGDELFPEKCPASRRRFRRGPPGYPGGHRALQCHRLGGAGRLRATVGRGADRPHSYPADRREALLEGAERDARTFLDEQAERITSEGGTVTETHLMRGRADREIVHLSEEVGAGLIVMGSRGLGGVRRALMGSVSDSVVRHAHCPVFVVRTDEER
jgi:nucleotide-binding universal stress UspA family protein